MASIIHAIRTKGFINAFRRIGMITYRYSLNGFLKSFNTILEVVENNNAKVTFPITAVTLARNIDLIKDIKSKSIEWAMHGYIHTDYTKLNKIKISNHIEKGKKIFRNANLKVTGFRSPYLRTNNIISDILSRNNFTYDSSKSFFINIIPSKLKTIKLIIDFYKPINVWKINYRKGIKEIPVCFPDDEILVDRLKLKEKKIGEIWIKMCQEMNNLDGIPVIQLHPERGRICKIGLEMVLDWARKNDVRAVYLNDIAISKNRNEKMIAITGDIDFIKISDLRRMNMD